MLRVDYARWGQTPEDLRHLALSAPHTRTRERALALFDITQHRCATQVAVRTGRHPQTVMDWVHAYNERGPAWCRDQLVGAEELSGVGERPFRPVLPVDPDRALQAQPGPPSPYSATAAQGHKLAGLRCQPAPAWKFDDLVQR